MTTLGDVKEPADWPKTRKTIESLVQDVLGRIPRETTDPQPKVVDEREMLGFVRRRVNYFVDDWTRVTAWVFVPEDAEDCPAILCMHRATAMGKDEPAGLEGADPLLAFAQHYAERGYVTIAPDCITCGERIYSRLEPFDTKSFYKEHPKMSAIGKMLWDHMRALDVVCDMKEVDPSRLGAIGHDMGAYNALFLAAFDDRVRSVVASCGITAFGADAQPERWAQESGLVLLPKMRPAIENRDFPFDWDEILALIAPNPTLLITALNDEILSNTSSVEDAVKRARAIYGLLGADGALSNFTHKEGHRMTPEALDAADTWFDRWL